VKGGGEKKKMPANLQTTTKKKGWKGKKERHTTKNRTKGEKTKSQPNYSKGTGGGGGKNEWSNCVMGLLHQGMKI